MTGKRNDLPASYRDIPLPPDWLHVIRVRKGWSRELKYRVATRSRRPCLLRVRPGGVLAAHQQEFDFVLRLYERGLPVPRPHVLGETALGQATFMLLDWLKGRDLNAVMRGISPCGQYRLGLEAGLILRGIHDTPRLLGNQPTRDIREKSLDKIRKFEEAGLQVEGAAGALAFVRRHITWLGTQAPVCQHGDFHPGNLIYSSEGRLQVIDFNRWDVGDPVEEFYKLQSFTIDHSVPFAVGQLHGYCGGDPDDAFWQSLAVHVAVSSLYSIRWATPFGPHEVAGMAARCARALSDYAGFTRLVPAWYRSPAKAAAWAQDETAWVASGRHQTQRRKT